MNIVAALLYAVSSSAIAALLMGFAGGGLGTHNAAVALVAGLLVAIFALWHGPRKPFTWFKPGLWEWAAVILFSLFSLRAFLWLIFHNGDSLMVLSPNNLGDMSLHIGYIRQLAGGVPFWPDNPIYAGAKLTYPIGMDLFNTLLVLVGVNLERSLIWVGLAGAALTGIALWRWGRGFVLAGFLCNGGVFGVALLQGAPLADFQSDEAWKSIPLALFVTQRGFLFALPAGLSLLCSWRARFFNGDPQWRLPLWGEVLLYSSMPLFHLHTFLFLSFILGSWFFLNASARKPLLGLVAASIVPATMLVLLVTGSFQGASVIGWKPGWMQEGQDFFLFWFLNFGLLPFLLGALCYLLIREEPWNWPFASVFPALLIFLLCCFVKFAPWEWDNTKIMIWSYLVVLPVLWTHLLAGWRRELRFVACAFLFFSGFVSLMGGIAPVHRGYHLALRSNLDAIDSALLALPRTACFGAAPNYNHPLLLLGRELAMGYEGHAWSHGYDYLTRREQLADLMNGADNWREIAQLLKVRYIFWGPDEETDYPESEQPWRKSAALVAEGTWGRVYDLSNQ